jgi:mono/diheme cytochrome c family protein
MPAWKDELTEEQRWDVINYIRTFADTNPNAAPEPYPSPAVSPAASPVGSPTVP